ncbi:MAG: class I SAM-dependent methyltransferase [Bacteroidota bacterium]|jgi:2-polyprenyl-3-methyl-5-hydroxy-6-metoxy-1,4-benzoquinol methylase
MQYDPIKKIFGDAARNKPWLRILFYKLLGVMFLREWYVKRELRRQLDNHREPFTVYDAGSGFGQYSYFIAKQFPLAIIYGVDVKEEQIADCNQFFRAIGLMRCSFAVEDLTHIQHKEKFEVILSVDVMEHIPDDVGVFQNFYRALKKNGQLFINTPSNLGGSDAHSEGDHSFVEEHARNGYSVEEIRNKLEAAGFHVEMIRYTYGHWGTVAWRLGIKFPLLLLNASKAFFVLLPLYYLIVLPLVLPMMWLDYSTKNKTGTGLNVVAKKA